MKKLFLLAGLPLLVTAAAFGQGTVLVGNTINTLVSAPGLTTNNLAPVGTEIEAFYQPGGGSAPAPILSNGIVNLGIWEVGASAEANPFPLTMHNGRFNGGAITTGTDVAPGGNAWLTVIAWTGGFEDLQTAVDNGAAIGESTVFELATGDVLTLPPGTPTPLTASNRAEGFVAGTPFGGIVLTLSPIPEPSTIAVGSLGMSALLFFRRRAQG